MLEGEHDASYWEAHLGHFLRFYSDAFARHAATEVRLEPAQVPDVGLIKHDAADDGSLGP
ncbi:MAG: hypothetical protein M3O34_12770 [Chloroflexota bacterium]|nr:hypothetical protein [Chloroflexota bacterium]